MSGWGDQRFYRASAELSSLTTCRKKLLVHLVVCSHLPDGREAMSVFTVGGLHDDVAGAPCHMLLRTFFFVSA